MYIDIDISENVIMHLWHNINSVHITPAAQISMFETQFDIGLNDQNYNVKINGTGNQPRTVKFLIIDLTFKLLVDPKLLYI